MTFKTVTRTCSLRCDVIIIIIIIYFYLFITPKQQNSRVRLLETVSKSALLNVRLEQANFEKIVMPRPAYSALLSAHAGHSIA